MKYSIVLFVLLFGCVKIPLQPMPIYKNTCSTFSGIYNGATSGVLDLIICRDELKNLNGGIHTTWSGGERAAEIIGVYLYDNVFLVTEDFVTSDTGHKAWCNDTRYVFKWEKNFLKGNYFSVNCSSEGSFRLKLQSQKHIL